VIARGLIAVTLLSALVACGNSTDKSESPTTPTTSQASSPSTPGGGTVPPASTPPPVTPPPTTATVPSKTPFPTAKDGRNYKACNDGKCEVLIRKAASFTLQGKKVQATVVKGTLKLTFATGYVSMSGTGYSSWSDGGPTHSATLKASDGDNAILILTTR
jgi:hypothetical protein